MFVEYQASYSSTGPSSICQFGSGQWEIYPITCETDIELFLHFFFIAIVAISHCKTLASPLIFRDSFLPCVAVHQISTSSVLISLTPSMFQFLNFSTFRWHYLPCHPDILHLLLPTETRLHDRSTSAFLLKCNDLFLFFVAVFLFFLLFFP